ncbi:bleomycin resistance family protein [Pedobacter frigiditerrae]|uniref:Bleomycin resistance family protein n=1 Tax=Pedobacter frigiditerrae TaxID=2530452 RepID=A0A4V2MJH7_9SPHI|nr:VOC family protein [Pedobacter frigiditerrae]TCC94316.1 bleomycin resistance family protein [Pedobacter frigiditerrae]
MKINSAIPAFPVINIQKAVDFYEAKLGFMARHQEKYFAIVVRDGVEIHLWAACDNSWKFRNILLFLKPIWSGSETFIAGTAHCRMAIIGIDELHNEYKEKKVLYAEHDMITEQHWGQRDFAIRDYYGNLITFFEEVI